MADILYIARHGETTWNVEGRIQGRGDSPLTPLGIMQSERLALALADKEIDKVFSSPLGRATQTAHHLDRPLVQDERLIERSFGRFEGCQKIELTREGKLGLSLLHPNEPDSKPPGGESMGDAARRARSFLDTARDQPERVIAAVTHGQILQALLASIENNDLYEKYRHRNGAYAMIRWIGQEPQIARWNVADHLTVAKLHAQPCPDHTELRS